MALDEREYMVDRHRARQAAEDAAARCSRRKRAGHPFWTEFFASFQTGFVWAGILLLSYSLVRIFGIVPDSAFSSGGWGRAPGSMPQAAEPAASMPHQPPARRPVQA